MTSLKYEDYLTVCEKKNSEYRDEIRAVARKLVDEGKSFEDMAELFMDSKKCIAFDHALFCYYMLYREQSTNK